MKNLIEYVDNLKNDIIITGHKNADYDSMCSSLALALILKKFGKNVKVYIEKSSINKIKYFNVNDLLIDDFKIKDFSLIILDLNRISRLPDEVQKKYNNAANVINIDHHNGNSTNADFIYSDEQISSTSEIIYNLAKSLNIVIDKQIAELLYVGIVSDTNSFSNNCTKDTFQIVGDLLSFKIDANYLTNKFYLEKTSSELEVISEMIKNIKYDTFHYVELNMKIEPYNKVEYIDISKKCIPTLLSNNEITVLIVIMNYGNKIKGEIRSKGNINVEKLATLLIGGGHTNAAGFSNKKTVDEIITISKKYLGEL